jgi:hypothetical protein
MRTINRRLRKLEDCIGLPTDEPQTIQIHFVSTDGVVTLGPLFTLGEPGRRTPGASDPTTGARQGSHYR